MAYLTVPLDPSFDRKSFHCGKPMLDRYLHEQAGQDMKRQLAVVFVLPNAQTIKGYYSLSNFSIPAEDFPQEIRQKYPPSYRSIPATLMGRLAVDSQYHGQGLGATLLIDAMRRSLHVAQHSIASTALIVDPLDDDARRFYEKYGFILIPGSGKMFLPMATIAKLWP